MTPEERDKVMFRLAAAWPRPSIPDATMLVWTEHLSPLDFTTARKALGMLERTKSRQPSLAEFWECYEACKPSREENSMRELPADDDACSPEVAKQNLERIRESLLSIRATMDKAPIQRGKNNKREFLKGSPARRPGTVTGNFQPHVPSYKDVYGKEKP